MFLDLKMNERCMKSHMVESKTGETVSLMNSNFFITSLSLIIPVEHEME